MAKYYKKRPAMKYATKRRRKPQLRLRVRQETLIALLVILLVLTIGCVWYLGSVNSNLDPAAKKGTLSISENSGGSTSANTISIILNTSPCFEDGTSPGNIFFENPAHSGKLERLEIYMDDTDELIYKSGYLEPGTYIDYAPLDVDLDAGEYKCTAVIYGYDKDAQEYLGRVAAGIVVYVLN